MRKFLLTCILFCLAAFSSQRSGFARSLSPIPEDLRDYLLKQGWTEVSPGVMQHSLGGNRVETLGFGAEGLRFQLRELRAHLVDLRKDFAQHPSRQLRAAIRAQRVQILRIEEALRKAKAVDGLEVSAEGLIADGGNGCPVNYDAAAIAYPLAPGAGSKAAVNFTNTCGHRADEVYAHSQSRATAANNTITLVTQTDPPSGIREGENVSAYAETSVNGVSACSSYAYASVTSYGLGISYSQMDQNDLCVSSSLTPWTKTDVGAVGQAGGTSYDNVSGVFRLTVGGTFLGDTADGFHFVYKTLSGDGTIVANVAALLNPPGAFRTLAGVTFRNDLTAGSAHATMVVTSDGEAGFRRRTTAGGPTAYDTPVTATFAPQWLKLVRQGNAFTAYLSADGVTWTQASATQTVDLSNTVHVGILALRNGSSSPTGAARFENVTVSPLTVPAHNYFAVNPCRILDTRNTTILTNNQPRVVNIAGSCGIPGTAKAVSVNVTAVSPTDSGKISLYPGNFPSSWSGAVSSVNFVPATSPRANSAVIQLATDGTGTIGINPQVAGSPGQVHLTLDVDGYFSTDTTPALGAQGPLGFQTLPVCRIADTQSSTPLTSGPPRTFTAQGVCGIPVGAAVASLHIGVPAPAYGAHITLFPGNISYPGTATINVSPAASQWRNGARVRLSPTTPDFAAVFGTVTPGAYAHAHFDVNGYFKSDAPLKYRPITPCRVFDTTSPSAGGPLATGTVRNLQVQGTCGVPVGAKAVVVRLGISVPTSAGELSVFPSNQTLPAISTVKFNANEPGLSLGATVALSTLTQDLSVSAGQMTAGGTVNLAVDVFGYFQ